MMIPENEYGTAAIQNELLGMLKDVDRFCRDNEIRYCLAYGSCLGAVRHNGFIPWDDDLDIIVDRENHYKLVKLFYRCSGYELYKDLWLYRIRKKQAGGGEDAEGAGGNPGQADRTPKIDVFVIDHVPDNRFIWAYKKFLLSMYQGMLKTQVSYEGFPIYYRACLSATHLLGKLFSRGRVQEWYDDASQIGNRKETKYVHCSNGTFKDIKVRHKSDTWNVLVPHQFEDMVAVIPEQYDYHLTMKYGDYMTPPPMEERVGH